MASFSEKLKEAQENAIASTYSLRRSIAEEPAVMTLSADDGIAVYAGEEWIKDKANYRWFDDFEDDNYSIIDDKKTITFNEKQINISQEENSQFIPFEMPRRYDGYDLVKTTISIHYDRSDGSHGSDQAVNVQYNDEKIRFAWKVSADASALPGKLNVEIHATGVIFDNTGKEYGYEWKTKSNSNLDVLKSICGTDCDGIIKIDDSWVQELVTAVAENVAKQIADAQIGTQVTEAQSAATRAEIAANNASTAATSIVKSALANYSTTSEMESYISQEIEKADISDKLADYALKTELPDISGKSDIGHSHTLSDITDYEEPDLSGFALKEEVPSIEGLASETYVQEEISKIDVSEQLGDTGTNEDGSKKTVVQYVDEAVASVDVTEQLVDYAKSSDVYTKTETYNKDEVDTKLSNVKVDLTGYAKESYVQEQISPINTAITSINQTLEGIDKSPRTSYDVEYGSVELPDGSTAENIFQFLEIVEGKITVKKQFPLAGGSGSSSSVTMKIAYVDGYGTPLVSTVDDKVILKYDFSGEDSAGDTNLDGIASWKVGSRVVKTQDVSTGVNEFDLTEYVNIGDNKILLTITHATGAIATKAWTIKVVDVRLVKSFDDTRKYPANSPINYVFVPYGGIEKNVHFILDGEEIGTKVSLAASSGLSDSYDIPAHEHGTHLLEVYMTAKVNDKDVESNHIFSDIIWYDETSEVPVISCVQQEFTARQYETTNIDYTVYDPSTETPVVTRKATYVNEDGEIVETYNSTVTLTSNKDTWSFKTDVIGEHTLTITCGTTVKTLKATVAEIGIEVSPTTTGLVFDFNPVGKSNNDENRLWSNDNGIAMTVSDNFDWVNGGYQIDENGDQYFCIKAGTSAEINYELFGDDAKTNGKQMKLIFKTENVADSETTFLECLSDTIGTDPVGIEMKAQTANIYAKTESLPLPYAEEEIIEFEFNITKSTDTIPMVMGYEDGVSTRPMVYGTSHDFQQHKDHRKIISLGSADCDLYIYRFKVYNTSLSDRDILNNFIADARSAEEMIDRYERNQIYQEGILTPEYLAEKCPDLRIIKIECPRFTNDKDDKVAGTTIECIYKNGDPILDNWIATDCVHSGRT